MMKKIMDWGIIIVVAGLLLSSLCAFIISTDAVIKNRSHKIEAPRIEAPMTIHC